VSKQKLRITIGIDPGSGSSSPTAVGAIMLEPLRFVHVEDFWPKSKSQNARLRELNEFATVLLGSIDPDAELTVVVESFCIRGRGNQILQQVIGALKAAVPAHAQLIDVPNTTVKRLIGGSGKADKQAVAAGVAKRLNIDVSELSPDQTDALAIALAAMELADE